MIDIKINITNKIATAIGTPFIVCGNSDYTVTFTFDAEWGAYQEKTARFFFVADGIEQYIDVLFSGNTCNAPVLPNIEKVLIGVYTGNLRTTTGAEVRCKRSILFGGKVHEPPTTEDVYNEILEIVGKKLGSEGGTVTGDYFKDGNTFIHEGNLDLLDETDNFAITKTATGSAITIDSAKAPLQNLKLYGKTTQNGTPTPDAPVPLVSVGDSGSFEVGVYGKNLLEITTTTQTINGVTFTVNADKSITANGTASATTQFRFVDVPFIPKGEYIISGYPQKVSGVEYYFKATGEGWTQRVGEASVTYTEDTSAYGLIAIGANITVNNLTFYPMLRRAEITDNTYEPCNSQTLTMPYTLRSVGDVEDEIDFARGVLIQRCASIIFNGSETWNYNTGNKQFVVNPVSIIALRGVAHKCSHYANKQNTDYGLFLSGAPSNAFNFQDTRFNGDVNAYKEWLSANPVTVVFVRATPQEIPLTETELNAYRQLLTNKGTTNILCSADMELDYYINKPNAQAIGSLHEQINKDYIKLQQAIISTGGNV